MVAGMTAPTVGGKISAGGIVGQLQTYATGLVHGEWTYSVSCPNATQTSLSVAGALVTASTSANIATAVGTSASGFTAVVAGVYFISLQANLTVTATGRSFVSILYNGTSTEYRGNTSADDQITSAVELYMTAGSTVAFWFYQTSTATRVVTGRFHISYRGGL